MSQWDVKTPEPGGTFESFVLHDFNFDYRYQVVSELAGTGRHPEELPKN